MGLGMGSKCLQVVRGLWEGGVRSLGVNGCGIACGHISHGHITITIAGVIR